MQRGGREGPHGNARNTFSKVIDQVVVAVSVAFDVSVIRLEDKCIRVSARESAIHAEAW